MNFSSPFRSMPVFEPRLVENLVAALAVGEAGDLGAVLLVTDAAAQCAVIVDAAYSAGLGRLDGFAATVAERLVELARCYQPRSGAPSTIFCDGTIHGQVARHERGPGIFTGVQSLAEWVGVIAYPDFIEADPAVRAKTVASALAAGTLRISPECAEKARHHPFDALTRQRFGPFGEALSLALGLAMEVVRDPPPRRRVGPRKSPHSGSAGQGAAR